MRKEKEAHSLSCLTQKRIKEMAKLLIGWSITAFFCLAKLKEKMQEKCNFVVVVPLTDSSFACSRHVDLRKNLI